MATHRMTGNGTGPWFFAVGLVALLVGALGVTAGCTLIGKTRNQAEMQRRIERGKYLVTIGGCHDCHTPWVMGTAGPEPDMTRMLSGHPQDVILPPAQLGPGPWEWMGSATNTAFTGPWGTSYAFNLTPDEMTGIGIWTEEIFMNTIRSGKHWGVSRPILPPMPWFNYRQMTDEDLRSVFAYLRTIPPVRNKVPDAVPIEEVSSN